MELTITDRLRTAGQPARAEGTKKESPSSVSGAQFKEDRLSLTRQAVEQMEEQSRRLMNLIQQDQQSPKKPAIWDMLDGETKSGDSETEMLGEQLKTMERCHKIAARIIRGDKVPPQDEQYLMMNDPDGYKLALAMRTPKRKPKEWDSVLKDDEKKTSERSSGEAPQETSSSGETEAASGSGGDAAPDGGE